MFGPALRLFSLVLFVTAASATNMKMALANPSKYLFYDTTPFRLGMHAGLTLLLTYGILTTFTLSVMFITRALEKKKLRRRPSTR
ncbi:unnamed protein product [Schistocephalus solidus]|uniref:Cytochrome c oxidase subunit I n=1 Tax=Schistocephalus solidus TaxID=70667 RepID=A0A183TTI6_SCHSO|nr:unnamed protein product [Schistocephalus solidus]